MISGRSCCLSRLPEELQQLQQSQTIQDYPVKLVRDAQQQLNTLRGHIKECREAMLSPDVSPSTLAAYENKLQFYENEIVHIVRLLLTLNRGRQHLLQQHAVRVYGQQQEDENSGNKNSLYCKLSKAEIEFYVVKCEQIHMQLDEIYKRNHAERRDKPNAVADVVFKKDCVLENPWHFESDTNEFLSSSETTSNTPHARYFAQGSFCRLPLFKAIKLRAKGIVDVMDIHKHQWVLMDITAANEKDLLGSRV